ncbi:MAG: DUF760 domain-containing protein [Symploca sp. SIO3C6]|uniref:DUF760 domain-containing protein n=1 Tax=Symploca sp. SIO1C4 TaxID=2607765 RepID=A0A6B3NK34_9CYAN|nr:DUF760 domain-containing protein [Symploca sp. SIO3C6]NER31235.1 DUF760 domain-containing protein [Symploca sp. SIO1C4]NET04258.1 DUF760 domain-containing protein [Symploca sp. SIO2B6]NET53100.1 DUF760 domain-containing protein [Merismopedia sp. SIO2A8]
MVFNPNFLNSQPEDEQGRVNQLLNYLQNQSPDVLSHVARSASPEIQQIISQNVQGLVGMLPSEHFNVQITTDRENLAGLLASAMMTGYFLRQMEQRMELEATLFDSTPVSGKPHQEKNFHDAPQQTEQ